MPSSQQQQFTILTKSKLQIKCDKINRKQKLRQINPPKILIDSDIQDGDEQQQRAKKKAKKWWGKIDRKYFNTINMEQADQTISKVQQINIGVDNQLQYWYTHRSQEVNSLPAHTIRVLFRRQLILDQQQQNMLFFYQWNNLPTNNHLPNNNNLSTNNDLTNNNHLSSNNDLPNNYQKQIMYQQNIENIILNGIQVQFPIKKQTNFPNHTKIWSFRNIRKDNHSFQFEISSKQEDLNVFQVQKDHLVIQKLLKQQKDVANSLDRQIRQLTKLYHKVFQQNELSLNDLAQKIEVSQQKRRLQEQLKQKQQLIIRVTQSQLIWSQILLLFCMGHSDKTQLILQQAQQIVKIKQMHLQQSLRRKKSTQVQKLKALYQTDCKICFCTQTDIKINKVFYCGLCNTSFHQICYGIKQIDLNAKFYCDVCKLMNDQNVRKNNKTPTSTKLITQKMDTKLDGKAKKPSCQLCCKPNFPMKFIDSHFYHVTCLFMFDFAYIQNSMITIRPNISFEQVIEQVSMNELQSGHCQFCLKYSGMKFKCSSPLCLLWYHPICAYLNGIYFNLKRYFRDLEVNIYCQTHSPRRNVLRQIYVRRVFCEYKRAQFLSSQLFEQEYSKQLKYVSKQRVKLIKQKNDSYLLLKRFKSSNRNYSSTSSQSSSLIINKNSPDESHQELKLQDNEQNYENYQPFYQFFGQNRPLFEKLHHQRMLDQELDLDLE